MARVFGIALAIGLLFALIAFAALKLPISLPLNAAPLETAHAPQAIQVSVPKLWADYRASEVAANDRYKAKRLVVEGQVASANKGITDNVYLLLSTFDASQPVHADMKAEYRAEAARLQTGQIVTLDCEGGGTMMGNLFLMNCSMQPNATPEAEPQPERLLQTAPTPAAPDVSANSNAQGPGPTEKRVTLPSVIYQAPAEYTAEARRNKLEGIVQVQLLVDENGNPQNVAVARSLGMGLDESAVVAVKHYKFKPAVDESTGKAIPARMNIGLQFHLP